MTTPPFTSTIDLALQLRAMQEVYRKTPKRDGQFENNAEHSWGIGMLCMLLAPMIEVEFARPLDMVRVYEMALVHDLAEIITGDTPTWETNTAELRAQKGVTEEIAINELLKNAPPAARDHIFTVWLESEKRETLEAKFVKSVDRMDPVLHRIYFNVGLDNIPDSDNSAESKIDALNKRQYPRHNFSTTMTECYNEVIQRMRE